MKTLKSLAVIGSLVCASVAWADDELDLNNAIVNLNAISQLAYAKTSTYGAVSAQTGVPVVQCVADRRATGLNYGDLLVAESIATATGKSVHAVVAEQAKGQSWASVARHNRINPASLTARLQTAAEVMHAVAERSYNKQRRQMVSDNYGRMQGNAQALEQAGVLGH
jgi:hypothetical protein